MLERRHAIVAVVVALAVDAAAFGFTGPQHPLASWIGLWLALTLVGLVLAPLLERGVRHATETRLTTPPPVLAVLPLGGLGFLVGAAALDVVAAAYELATAPGLAVLGQLAARLALFAGGSLLLRWAVSRWARASRPA